MDKICYTYRVAVRPFPFKGKEHFMGKNLKGKDCGKGIYQRKDGLYSARFVDKTGKRHEKYFQTIPEARNWMEEAKYADKHEEVFDVKIDTLVAICERLQPNFNRLFQLYLFLWSCHNV